MNPNYLCRNRKNAFLSSLCAKSASVILGLFLLIQPLAPVFAEESGESEQDLSQRIVPATSGADEGDIAEPPPSSKPPEAPETSEEVESPEEVGKVPPPPSMAMGSETVGASPTGAKTSYATKVDQQDGSFSYQYPILGPPGRNGMQPNLQLEYNSNHGSDEDIFGYGWSINIPYIELFNKTGSNQFFIDPHYYSSFSGELVQVGTTTEYRAKIESGDFIQYIFSNNIWTVTDSKGTIYKMGSTTASRQDNTASSTQINKWMVDEIRDTNDNFISYSYYKTNNKIYPTSISYTGSGATAGPFTFDFQLSTTTNNSVAYNSGFAATTTQIVAQIQARISNSWVRKYEFVYTTGDNSARKILDTITESGREEGGSGTVSLPATNFDYQETMSSGWTANTNWTVPEAFSLLGKDNGTREVDVDGDGFVDIVRFYKDSSGVTTKKIYLNNHSNGWTATTTWNWGDMALPFADVSEGSPVHDMGARFADVNGDSRMDVVVSHTSSNPSYTESKVYINRSDGWYYDPSWAVPLYFTRYNSTLGVVADNGTRMADVNGDGLPDFVYSALNTSVVVSDVYINNGAGWTYDTTWKVPKAFSVLYSDTTYGGRDLGTQLIDVNGDGLADVVNGLKDSTFGNSQVSYLNTGSGWATSSTWTVPDYLIWNNETVSDIGFRFEDVNSDGLVDIALNNNASCCSIPDNELYVNTGAGWSSSIGVYPTQHFTSWTAGELGDAGARFMDVNADKRADIVLSFSNIASGTVTSQSVLINDRTVGDLMSRVTESKGGILDVEYRSSHEYRSGGEPLSPDLSLTITTVATTTYDSGFGNTWTEKYTYENGNYWHNRENVRDRRFAGFNSVTKTTDLGKERTYFYQGNTSDGANGEYFDTYYKIGFPYRTESSDLSDKLYSLTTSKWNQTSLGDNAYFVKQEEVIESAYDGDSDHKDRATTFTYDDAKGVLTEKVEWGEVLATTTTTSTSTNQSLDLEASSTQYVRISDPSQANLDFSTDMTVEAWVKPETQLSSNEDRAIVTKWNSTDDQVSYYFYYSANAGGVKSLVFRLGGPPDPSKLCTLSQTLTPGQWYHIAATHNGSMSSTTIYVNGSSIGSCSGMYSSIYNSNAYFAIGTVNNTPAPTVAWDGLIEDVRAWSTVRTASEVNTNKSTELTGYEDGLKGYWKMNGNSLGETVVPNNLYDEGTDPIYTTDAPFTSGTITELKFVDNPADKKRITQYTYASSTAAHIVVPQTELLMDNASNTVQQTRFYYDTQVLGTVTDGNLTKQERWATSTSYIDEEKTYNTYGLVTQSKDARDKATTYAYDSLNLYSATTTNPLSQTVARTYNYSSGQVATTTDPNNFTFVTVYDALDRPKEEKIPDPSSGTSVRKSTYTYTDTSGANAVNQKNYLDSSTTTDAYVYFDGFGRKVQDRAETETNNQYSVRDTVYDDNGLLYSEALPYLSTGSARTSATANTNLYTSYTYDPMGRLGTTTTIVGDSNTAYDQWTELVTDTEDNLKGFAYDSFGRLATTTEYNATTSYANAYQWTSNNNLATITDALGNIREVTYDGLGRRTSMQDLHTTADTTFGTWRFEYDLAGNVSSSSDPKNQVINYTYDDVNRPLTENYTGQAGTEVTYTYDTCTNGKGHPCQTANSSATTTYTYTPTGLPDISTTTIATTSYAINYNYDRQGNQTSLIYPDNSEVEYLYNTAGQMEQIRQRESGGVWQDIIVDLDYGPHGLVTYQRHGNGASTTKTYDANELYRLKNVVTTTTGGIGGAGGEFALLQEELNALSTEELKALIAEEVRTPEVLGSSTEPMAEEEPILNPPEDDAEIIGEESATTTPGTIPSTATSTEPIENETASTSAPLSSAENLATSTESIATTTITELSTTTPLEIATTTVVTNIRDLLVGKTTEEIAEIKSDEIVKLNIKELYTKDDLDVEIRSVEKIDGGIQAFARAWKNGSPIGFGMEGDVEIERFRIYNPPILVPDPNGDIVQEWTTANGETRSRTLREDPVEALRQVLAHNIETVGKAHTTIEEGKIGNTTSTFYPSVDGYVEAYAPSGDTSFSNLVNGTSVSFTKDDTISSDWTAELTAGHATSQWFHMARGFFLFDTSAIPDSDTVATATLSLYGVTKYNGLGGTLDMNVFSSNPASNVALAATAADYNSVGANAFSTAISYASWSASVYNDFALNATGTAAISLTSHSKFSTRVNHDYNNTAPTWVNGESDYLVPYFAERAGTTQDPKLVVAHQAYPIAPTGLLTEGSTNPTNVTDTTPEFSAIFTHPNASATSSAYRIQVSTSTAFTSTIWDSAKTAVASSSIAGQRTPDVSYDGTDLTLSTTYYWRIQFWDHLNGEGLWSTTTASFVLISVPPLVGGIQNLSYTYDTVGNITQIVDASITTAAATTTYIYDDLYRLTSASTTLASSTPYLHTFSYNAIGNITYKSDVGTYTYTGNTGSNWANPHAATGIATTTYTYDKNGNLATTSLSLTNTWDYKNHLTQSQEGASTLTYTYDHSGQRMQKSDGYTITNYPFQFYESVGTTTRRNIYAGGVLVATISKTATTSTTYHNHLDHLSSTAAVSDTTGFLTQVLAYYPFGGTRLQTQYANFNQTNRYIGQDYDEENGLNYLQARYYKSVNGQFISQDPVFLDMGLNTAEGKEVMRNPQAMNSYSYAQNNPIVMKDPSGRCPICAPILGVFALYGLANTAVDVYNLRNILRYPEGYSPAEMDEAGNRVIKDMVSMGVGRLVGPDVRAGMDTFDAVYDTVVHYGGKVRGKINDLKNASTLQGGANNYTTPALPAGTGSSKNSNQTYISAPGSNKSSSNSSSSYNAATSYLGSAQKALNRGDTVTAQKYINKAKKSLNR